MDTTMTQTVSIQLPSSDMKLLKELAKKMGWTAKKIKSEKKSTEIDKAIADINKGDVKEFSSVKDMMNYLNT